MRQPPYLASQTAARMGEEPWSGTIPMLMGVFGALLIACFVLPWTVSDTTWAWSVFKGSGISWKLKLYPLLLVSTGFLAVVMAALPLANMVRAAAALCLGALPVLLGAFVLGGKITWQDAVHTVGLVTLVPGLILRSQYRDSLAARVITTIGVVCVILPLVVPQDGHVPLVELFKSIGDTPGKGKLGAIMALLAVVIAIMALLVWIPAPSSAGAIVLAWLLLSFPVLFALVVLLGLRIGEPGFGDYLKGGLATVFWRPIAAMAWAVLAGYGMAAVIGKTLERR